MKQIIRLKNISSEEMLDGYNLTVYEKQIVYVQSLSYRSLHRISEFFACTAKADSGTFVIDGREYEQLEAQLLVKNGICPILFGQELADHFSAAELLIMGSRPKGMFHLRRRASAIQEAAEYLKSYGFDGDPFTLCRNLSIQQRKKLSLIRAGFLHMRLAVAELTSLTDEGYHQQEIISLISRLRDEEGMSFLILSSRFSPMIHAADRLQFMQYGMAVKEWDTLSERVMEIMRVNGINHDAAFTAQSEKTFTGLYDPEWTDDRNIWQYLHQVKKENPEMWRKCLDISLPAEWESTDSSTVIIPRTSYALLPENLSIEENLCIAMDRRLTSYGVIQKHIETKLGNDFRAEYGIDQSVKEVSGLSRLQKKILSIERFVLSRPQTIILEDPYRSVHIEENDRLRSYLRKLADQGIRIIYFSRSPVFMREDCHTIFGTTDCKNFHLL